MSRMNFRVLVLVAAVQMFLACVTIGQESNRREAMQSILDADGHIGFENGILLPSFAYRELTIDQIDSPFSVVDIAFGNSENPITNDDLRLLAHFPELKALGVSGPQLSDDGLVHFEKLTSLEKIGLYNTQITPSGLANHAHLRESLITLAYYEASVNDSTLSGIEKLEGVYCVQILFAPNFSDEGLRHLAQKRNLKILDVLRTPISGAGLIYLKELPELQELGLAGTDVDNDAVDKIVQLRHLTRLDIRWTEIDENGVARLKQHLPNCRIIRLR